MTLKTIEMLDEQVQKTLEDLDTLSFLTDETQAAKQTTLLAKLTALQKQQMDIQKLTTETELKNRELKLREEKDKRDAALEEQKMKEQKKANITQAVIGGVGAATGVAGIFATLHCFKKSMIFEQTGSYTNKSSQAVGSMFNLFRKK